MKQTTDNVFFSPDLYLSAALALLLNAQPKFKLVNGKILFGYPADDNLYRAVTDFNSGALSMPLNMRR